VTAERPPTRTELPGRWIATIDPSLVDDRFGADVVTFALSAPRVYASPPAIDAAGRLVATVVPAPGGRRLSTPLKVAVRVREGSALDVACDCRGRMCDHVVWLLVDVAFHPPLREALARGAPTDDELAALERVRAQALEARTLDERLAAWLPARAFDDEWEIDVEAITIASAAAAESRAALLLRHRRPGSRALVPAKDILGARLTPRHRRLVELTAPYHLDRNVLVATRGQAAILAHLLRGEIGLFANRFKARARFASGQVSPRVEPRGDRLVARWYAADGTCAGDAADTHLLAGPFPYLWSPATHTFHEVSPDVDLDAALGMSRVPSLPLGEGTADRVGRALLMRGRGLGVSLPEPEVFGLPPLEKPSFELRLGGSPLGVTGELHAVYSIGKMPVGHGAPGEARDFEAEKEALVALAEAGLVPGDRGGLVATEEHAVMLWESGLAKLRASESPRFEVLVAESLARTKIGPPVELDIRVASSPGWLDTELEFRAGALGVEKEKMHQALVSNRRWLVVSDGSLAKIADEVASLVSEQLAAGKGAGKLPPHQFGRIARWLELADAPEVHVHVDPQTIALRQRLRDLATRPQPVLPARLEATLRPYQLVGLAWLQLLKELGAGGLLADDMGLGKTLMTLAFLARWAEEAAAQRPSSEGSERMVGATLVVCPTSLVGNWLREAERFTPDLRAIRWTGTTRRDSDLEEHDLVVTTYGVLRREVAKLARRRFRCIVLDEAQNAKNPASATSRAVRQLDAELRLALTGTPVENRLSELWSLMTFANPGMLGTARDFDERYERPIGLRPDGAVAAELRAAVRPFILRRTKAQVLVDLPPKTEIERACVFGLRQKRAYDALSLAVREAVRTNTDRRKDARTRLAVLTAILRLRQMACDPRLVDPQARPEDSAKRAAFLDLVRELVSEDRRALVFSQFVELLTLWRQDLDAAKVPYEWLDGSTTTRDAVVDRFQNGTAPIFLVSLKAGGAGLNLTAADTVIHCDPWWNPAAEDQATDRAHRIGQTKPVTVIRLVARGTIEDKIALLKGKKRELSAAILGAAGEGASGEDPLGALTNDDIDMLLGEADGEVDDDETQEPQE